MLHEKPLYLPILRIFTDYTMPLQNPPRISIHNKYRLIPRIEKNAVRRFLADTLYLQQFFPENGDRFRRTLEECGGNVTRAAQQIGISRKGLQLKMIKYSLRK